MVDASMSIGESHRIADKISAAIKELFVCTLVTNHFEPCSCALDKEASCICFLSEDDMKAMKSKS